MAKKRKRMEEKKEELEYKPPEFDRLEYVKTEVAASKATIIAALFAIPIGMAAWYVMPVGGTAGGLMAGLGGMSLLWILLPKLKLEVQNFKWTQWAGVFSTHFLVFLAIWVVACNPPFSDMASPVIEDVQVSWDGGNWTAVEKSLAGQWEAARPANVVGNMTIRAVVTDNRDLNRGNVTIQNRSQPTEFMTYDTNSEDEIFTSRTFYYVASGSYFTITAYDRNGNAPAVFIFTVV